MSHAYSNWTFVIILSVGLLTDGVCLCYWCTVASVADISHHVVKSPSPYWERNSKTQIFTSMGIKRLLFFSHFFSSVLMRIVHCTCRANVQECVLYICVYVCSLVSFSSKSDDRIINNIFKMYQNLVVDSIFLVLFSDAISITVTVMKIMIKTLHAWTCWLGHCLL